MPNTTLATANLNRLLEENACKLGGRKLLYSFAYYTEEEFWKIYSKQIYEVLRKKYHAENVWMGIDQKMGFPSQEN